MSLWLDRKTGLLNPVRYVPSPNCDPRPDGSVIDMVVIHGISLPPGRYGGPHIDELFTNCLEAGDHPYFGGICHLRVSTHLFIDRAGDITQYVPLNLRAWHAGESRCQGRERCNDFSIGIELEGSDDDPYAECQYDRTAEIVKLLMQHWPDICKARVVGHSEIAPGRKTDPGPAFDWNRLYALL
jgi:N-acetyl-anhydromuramoyl-L-alanine amidase